MDNKTFEDIVQHQIELSTSVLIKKAGEYASDGDRLHNFRRAAGLRGKTKREVLGGMMLKHTVSVYDLIEMDKVPSEEYVEEKLTDHINYLLLLKAVLEEERREERLAEPQPEDANVESIKSDPALAALRAKLREPEVDGPVRKEGWYQHPTRDNVFSRHDDNIDNLINEGYTYMDPQPDYNPFSIIN